MAKEYTVRADEPQAGPDKSKTVLEAYDAIQRHRAFERLRLLKGKLHLDIDVDELRGRNR